MIDKIILQGLAATVIVAVFALDYAAFAKTLGQASSHSEAAR